MAIILVVEDDASLRETIVDALEDEGYEALSAPDGTWALELLESHPVDLVLSDVRMSPIDGLQLMDAMRQSHPKLPCILLTGFADPSVPCQAVAGGQVWDYLHKPITVEDMLGAVKRVLATAVERARLEKLMDVVTTSCSRLTEQARQHQRADFLRYYYVAVRSRALTEPEACLIWRQFERMDARFDRLDYQMLIDLLLEVAGEPRREPNARQFAEFFRRVRAGDVSYHELLIAPSLRVMSEDSRRGSPDLQELYSRLWG